jgi:CheY-like chemotaxis protein
VVETLSDLGYRVLKAKDAQSGLAIVDSGMPVDLLFTDVVMPGPLRSPELARKARERLPNIAVLFTSGYTDNAIVHGGRLDEGIELLSKPHTREALARKVRHVLRHNQQRNIDQASFPEPRHDPAPLPAASDRRSLHILMVEDDVFIRTSTKEMLSELGHTASEAERADEALALLDQDRFDVLLADINLPGMSGIELATEARRRSPDLHVIFASGYALASERPDHALADAVQLQKPYTEAALAEALKSVPARPPK